MNDMTPAEAARILERSPSYILRLVERGELVGRRIGPPTRGGRWLIDEASVERLRAAWAENPPQPGRRAAALPSAAAAAKRRSRARLAKPEGVGP